VAHTTSDFFFVNDVEREIVLFAQFLDEDGNGYTDIVIPTGVIANVYDGDGDLFITGTPDCDVTGVFEFPINVDVFDFNDPTDQFEVWLVEFIGELDGDEVVAVYEFILHNEDLIVVPSENVALHSGDTILTLLCKKKTLDECEDIPPSKPTIQSARVLRHRCSRDPDCGCR